MKMLRINLFNNIKEFNLTVCFLQVTVIEKVKKNLLKVNEKRIQYLVGDFNLGYSFPSIE